LKAALKRIEASKARREKTAQDVQRLIQEASRHSLSPEGSVLLVDAELNWPGNNE